MMYLEKTTSNNYANISGFIVLGRKIPTFISYLNLQLTTQLNYNIICTLTFKYFIPRFENFDSNGNGNTFIFMQGM